MKQDNRIGGVIGIAIVVILVGWLISQFSSHKDATVYSSTSSSNYSNSSSSSSWSMDNNSSASSTSPSEDKSTVPWDYKITESTVGDLIGGDMTLLPDNELLPNDDNYATGDKIWTLQFMSADMIAMPNGSNDIRLSSWEPIKSYKSKKQAEDDLANLKVRIKTEVDLVGVYKTELSGKFRQFAVLTLPSGHTIKQPIDEKRYTDLKTAKKVQVELEEVHDFTNYDSAMAKFRGWAQ
jgi:hypothetical protein